MRQGTTLEFRVKKCGQYKEKSRIIISNFAPQRALYVPVLTEPSQKSLKQSVRGECNSFWGVQSSEPRVSGRKVMQQGEKGSRVQWWPGEASRETTRGPEARLQREACSPAAPGPHTCGVRRPSKVAAEALLVLAEGKSRHRSSINWMLSRN